MIIKIKLKETQKDLSDGLYFITFNDITRKVLCEDVDLFNVTGNFENLLRPREIEHITLQRRDYEKYKNSFGPYITVKQTKPTEKELIDLLKEVVQKYYDDELDTNRVFINKIKNLITND